MKVFILLKILKVISLPQVGHLLAKTIGGSTVWAQDAGDDYGPGFAASGSYSAFFNDYDYPSATSGAMISPDIDLTSAVSPTLYFAYWDVNGSDYVDVQVSNADGSYTSVYTTPLATTGWEDLEVDLTSYVGQVVSIRFVGTVPWCGNPHVDNIVVSSRLHILSQIYQWFN